MSEPWPLDPREFFLEALPARLRGHAGALSGVTSTGSLGVCLEAPAQSFGLRLVNGELLVTEGLPPDPVARVRTTRDTFRMLVERVAPALAAAAPAPARSGLAARLAALEEQRAQALRDLGGIVAVVATEGAIEHRVELASGAADPAPPVRICTLRLSLADLLAVVAGRLAPIQIMMSGQLVVEGDAELMMGLLPLLG